MKFKHKSPVVDVFVWNGESEDQLPSWLKSAGVRIDLDYDLESDREGPHKKDVMFYNTRLINDSYYYEYQSVAYKHDILIYDPIEGVKGTNAAYFYRNYEPAE